VKAVFDTNVLFAALVTQGLCAKLLRRARLREFELVICPSIRKELRRALTSKLRCSPKDAAGDLALIDEAVASGHTPPGSVRGVCRDPDDDAVLDCASSAGADYLVTGDDDLLSLIKFEGVPIVLPRQFELLFAD
jgi:putative PIN family toxin of toxin-antitoxin system